MNDLNGMDLLGMVFLSILADRVLSEDKQEIAYQSESKESVQVAAE